MSHLVCLLSYGLSGLGGPTRNIKVPAGIARKVIEARKPPNHDKVETFRGDSRNTPSTTNLEEKEIVDALGKDGNASMPEQVKRPNPWRRRRRRRKKKKKKKMMMMMMMTTMMT